MAFKVLKKGEPKIVRGWPVVIAEPGDGGSVVKHKIKVDYELMQQADIDALVAEGDIPLLARAVHGWAHVQDEDGGDLPCNEENKAMLLGITWFRAPLLRGLLEAQAGGARKN